MMGFDEGNNMYEHTDYFFTGGDLKVGNLYFESEM